MQINEIIPATLLVRRAMKFHGKTAYTNRYESCRTVKCYRPRDSMKEVELVGDIRISVSKSWLHSILDYDTQKEQSGVLLD